MRKVCLEDLAHQTVMSSANSVDTVDGLQAVDDQRQKPLVALSSNQTALVELGVMGSFLQQKGSELNQVGAVFANLAFESVFIAAGVQPVTVVDAASISNDPKNSLEKSNQVINGMQSQLAQTVKRNLEQVLHQLAIREVYVRKGMRELTDKVSLLEKRLNENTTSIPSTEPLSPLWQGSEMLMRFGEGDYPYFEPGARDICSELVPLIRQHSQTFTTLVSDYASWVDKRSANVMAYDNGFNELVFDAKAHIPLSLDQTKEDCEVRVSNDLPGMFSWQVTVKSGKHVGVDVPTALMSIKSKIDWSNPPRRSQQMLALNSLENDAVIGVNRLTSAQAAARLVDVKSVLDAMDQWVMRTRTMWDQDVVNRLMRYMENHGDHSLQARFTSELCVGLLWLSVEGSSEIPKYIFSVLDNLLRYIELSISLPAAALSEPTPMPE